VIIQPLTGATFAGGVPVSFQGTATDPEDGVMPASAMTWRVDYITGTVERQALPDTPGVIGGTFTPAVDTPFLGTDVLYRVVLTVRDSAGLETSTSVDLSPQVGTLNLATNPAGKGLRLTVDGTVVRDAAPVEGVVGVNRVVVAEPTQVVNGVTYTFVKWSDDVTDATRNTTTPAQPTTLTAIYQPGPDGTGNPADADLTSAVVAAPAGGLVAGGKGRMTVRVTNAGQKPVAGPMAFAVVASPDAFLDSDDTTIATVTKPVKLAPGKSRNVKLAFTVPANVPQGSYLLLVRPDAGGAFPETVESNNISASATPLAIGPAFSDLTGSLGVVTVAGVGAKRQARATLSLQNLGNSAYSGPVTVSLLASADATADAGDAVLATLPKSLKLKAGGRKALKLRAALGSLAAGSYHLVARLNPTGTPADANTANNDVASAGVFTVA